MQRGCIILGEGTFGGITHSLDHVNYLVILRSYFNGNPETSGSWQTGSLIIPRITRSVRCDPTIRDRDGYLLIRARFALLQLLWCSLLFHFHCFIFLFFFGASVDSLFFNCFFSWYSLMSCYHSCCCFVSCRFVLKSVCVLCLIIYLFVPLVWLSSNLSTFLLVTPFIDSS